MTGAALIPFPARKPRFRPASESLPEFSAPISLSQFEIERFERKADGLIDIAICGQCSPRDLELFARALRSAAIHLKRNPPRGAA